MSSHSPLSLCSAPQSSSLQWLIRFFNLCIQVCNLLGNGCHHPSCSCNARDYWTIHEKQGQVCVNVGKKCRCNLDHLPGTFSRLWDFPLTDKCDVMRSIPKGKAPFLLFFPAGSFVGRLNGGYIFTKIRGLRWVWNGALVIAGKTGGGNSVGVRTRRSNTHHRGFSR